MKYTLIAIGVLLQLIIGLVAIYYMPFGVSILIIVLSLILRLVDMLHLEIDE